MATSQNGRRVLETAPPRQYVPGTGVEPGRLKVWLTVAPGDDGFVLIEVARRFHLIEAIDKPIDFDEGTRGVDDWGWAYRPVRGQESGFSNHASGTAIDLNATQHPRGEHGTFTNAEKAKILAMLTAFDDPRTGHCVVRWGELYTTTVDGMHFEINGTPAQVARVAERLRAEQAAAPAGEEEDDMQTSDVLKLGPGNAAVLEQPDREVSVGEMLVGTWSTSRQLLGELKALRAEQAKTNQLLGELVAATQRPGGA